MTEKVCALPYRETLSGLEVLWFLHPIAGRQFVKGTLEVGELAALGAFTGAARGKWTVP